MPSDGEQTPMNTKEMNVPQPVNRQWLMGRRPVGDLTPEDFRYNEGPVPEPGDGEVLLRMLYFGFDSTQRLWMTEDGGYMPPQPPGTPVRTMGIGQVVTSRHPDYKAGDLVDGFMSWEDYVVVRPGGPMPLRVLPKANYPLSWNLGMFGVGGLTAYFGTVDQLRVQPGDTVVVSAATGATGHVVGGIAKALGAKKVIGFAGDADKCRWIVESGHYDAAINYKTDDIPARLRKLCPDGVDAYYDNVGGDILDEMFLHMKQRGRMVICGAMSQGYADLNFQGPKNYGKIVTQLLRVEGVHLFYFADRLDQGAKQLAEWVQQGKLRVEEDVHEGFEKAPALLMSVFTGKKPGKLILKVGDPA
jgi:NADPH-dependent curcumin reductase CurA